MLGIVDENNNIILFLFSPTDVNNLVIFFIRLINVVYFQTFVNIFLIKFHLLNPGFKNKKMYSKLNCDSWGNFDSPSFQPTLKYPMYLFK